MNLQQQEQFYQMMTRLKATSRPASTKEDAIVTEIVDGLIVSKPAKKVEYLSTSETTESVAGPIITDLQKSKAGSGTKYYDMSLPSTGDQVYKCGLHAFETKNITEFNRHVENHGSKSASVQDINKLKVIQDFINGKH